MSRNPAVCADTMAGSIAEDFKLATGTIQSPNMAGLLKRVAAHRRRTADAGAAAGKDLRLKHAKTSRHTAWPGRISRP